MEIKMYYYVRKHFFFEKENLCKEMKVFCIENINCFRFCGKISSDLPDIWKKYFKTKLNKIFIITKLCKIHIIFYEFIFYTKRREKLMVFIEGKVKSKYFLILLQNVVNNSKISIQFQFAFI